MKPGDRIKILRVLSGFTQEQIVELAGVNRASLVSWERGDYNPSAPAVESLGKVLLCPPGYILFGTPLPLSSYWVPSPPKANKYIKAYMQDIESLIPAFCHELQVTFGVYFSCNNSNYRLLFLGTRDSLKYVLLLSPLFLERFAAMFSGLSIESMPGPVPESVKTFDGLGLPIHAETISSFLKVRKHRELNAEEGIKGFLRNSFLHFHTVLQEFDPPDSWNPTTTRYPTLIDELSVIFECLYEEIKEKSLVWGGGLNKGLAEIIRHSLKEQGFIEKR